MHNHSGLGHGGFALSVQPRRRSERRAARARDTDEPLYPTMYRKFGYAAEMLRASHYRKARRDCRPHQHRWSAQSFRKQSARAHRWGAQGGLARWLEGIQATPAAVKRSLRRLRGGSIGRYLARKHREIIISGIGGLQQTQRFKTAVTMSADYEMVMQGYADPFRRAGQSARHIDIGF